MAGRIAGITIEIGGDTTNLQKSLKSVDSQLKTTQNNLKDINKLLKLDPSNTELLVQKQKNLESAISGTKTRLEELKNAQAGVKEGSEEWDRLQREIIATEQDLKGLEKEYKEFGSVTSQQLKAAGQSLQDYGDKVSKVGQKFNALSGAAAGALTAMGGMAYKAMQTGDEINTLSQQTGLSTFEIQKMQYAADLVDVSFNDITGALRKMKSKMDPTNKTFQELGVYVTDAYGNLRNADEVFYDTIEALSQIENETERDKIAMELFGKSADSLAGVIDDGGAALRDYGQQALDLGLILKTEDVDALNATNDTITAIKGELQGTLIQLGATITETLAPIIEKVVPILQDVTDKIRKLTPQQTETIMKILGIVAAIGPVLTIGGKLISMIGTITSVIGTVVGVLGGPLTLAIGAVIAIGVLLYKNWDTIKETAINVKESLVQTWDNLKTSVGNIIDGVKDKIENLKQKFIDLKDRVVGVVDRIRDAFNFNWSFPPLRLPHIQISYSDAGWIGSLFGITAIPHLSVQWYKKAYENAVMFNSPTVLATPNGYKGFGDGHGAEIVLGLDKLRELVGAQENGVTINVYGAAGQNEEQLADAIARRFVAQNKTRKAAGLI